MHIVRVYVVISTENHRGKQTKLEMIINWIGFFVRKSNLMGFFLGGGNEKKYNKKQLC